MNGIDLTNILNTICTPLVTLLSVWLINRVAPKVPTWLNPIIAPAIGAIIAFLGGVGGQQGINPILGALLGSAAVGLHQVKAQWEQHQIGTKTPPTK